MGWGEILSITAGERGHQLARREGLSPIRVALTPVSKTRSWVAGAEGRPKRCSVLHQPGRAALETKSCLSYNLPRP